MVSYWLRLFSFLYPQCKNHDHFRKTEESGQNDLLEEMHQTREETVNLLRQIASNTQG
jgi:hypothetical protein